MLDRNALIKERVIEPAKFLGKRFKPTVQTNYSFTKFFSLFCPDFQNTLEVKSIEWNMYTLQVQLTDISNGESLNLQYKSKDDVTSCSGQFCTSNICSGVHFHVSNKNFLRFLLGFSHKAKDLHLDSLLTILAKDFKAKRDYYQIFLKPERPPFSVIQNWAHPLQEFRFIVNEGFLRNTDQSINLNVPKISIHHSERECQGISPNNKVTGYHFFNFPKGYNDASVGKFSKYTFDKYYYLTQEEKDKYVGEGTMGPGGLGISTDLDENDVVMGGGNDKLQQALDMAMDYAEKNDVKLVAFNCCCVPRIVGDDVHSKLIQAREKMKIPFLFQGQFEKTPYEQKVMLLDSYINKIDFSKITQRENSISLFGYYENQQQKDMGDILMKNKIKINTSFIPSIDVRLLELMCQSKLFIFPPNNLQKEAFEYPFQKMGIEYIFLGQPFGMKNSMNWLETITGKFGITLSIPEHALEEEKLYYSLVEKVKEKNLTVGIVFLGVRELRKFFNTDYTSNVDVIKFLEEMGFSIKFMVFDNFAPYDNNNDESFKVSDGDHSVIEKMIYDKIEQKEKHSIIYFSDSQQFNEILDTTRIDIMYSDIYFDARISDRGKAQFNLRNFYVGISGALKTIQELTNLCEMHFYKKYAQYFLR